MKKNNICVGSLVEDLQGRQGVVTEVREDCNAIFVRPVDKPYVCDHVLPGLGVQKVITATAWHFRQDGYYHGCFAFDPLNFDTVLKF